MSKHIHADLMKQYWQDAMETDKPWERWECMPCAIDPWISIVYTPLWHPRNAYRRKPQTVTINGFEVPAPLKEIKTKHYFVECLDLADLYIMAMFGDKRLESIRLTRGIVHGSAACAIASCKARLGIDPEEK